jgi:hypothetical protein
MVGTAREAPLPTLRMNVNLVRRDCCYSLQQRHRHPEVRALASLEGCCSAQCARPSFEARKKERAPTGERSAFVPGMTAELLRRMTAEIASRPPRMTAVRWSQAHQKLPDGQLTFARENLSSPFAKNIPLCFLPKSVAYYVRPTRREGRCARHETRGGMRWTRKLRLTSVAEADGKVVWS